MKTLGTIILILLLFAGLSYAGDESFTEYKFLDMSRATRVCSITITNNDKEATINFCGDKVVYSGELPVDESAKLFFEYVFGKGKCEQRLYDALSEILNQVHSSSDLITNDLIYRTPAQGLREAADEIERRDVAIHDARKVLEECKP